MANIVAVLESMWNWQGCRDGSVDADRYFRISPDNFSGRRLYRLIGEGHSLLVTNACRELCISANHHGKPNPPWLSENLKSLEPFDLLLVCGRVAKETYALTARADCKILFMDHPAARRWSNVTLDATAATISALLVG
jgi:hypothetical protein